MPSGAIVCDLAGRQELSWRSSCASLSWLPPGAILRYVELLRHPEPCCAILEVLSRRAGLDVIWSYLAQSWMSSGTILCALGARLEPSRAILEVFVFYVNLDAIWSHLLRSWRGSGAILRYLGGHLALCWPGRHMEPFSTILE
eukprot:2462326-Pyramimonas_sp.AAC.4